MKKDVRNTVITIILAILCLGPIASATILATSGAADGMIGRDWYSSPNYYWVEGGGQSVNAYHDGGNRWWHRGLVIINISSLAGTTVESATFNFYSNGFSGSSLQYAGQTAAALSTAYGQISGTTIASLDGSTGWLSYDVTTYIQTAVANGYQNIGFVFNATTNYGGGSIASSESGNAAYLDVIPEPATIILIGFGGFFVVRRWPRKK